jgi:hypothetical protein
MIPKPGGGERPLGIPTIRDRVVQTAAKLLLEPIFEADFDPNAYGYRPKRSAQEAIQKVHKLLCAGYADVVDADLSKYFDTIPHSELMQCVARRMLFESGLFEAGQNRGQVLQDLAIDPYPYNNSAILFLAPQVLFLAAFARAEA